MLKKNDQELKISYKIQKGKSDRKHLLVIFSGLGSLGNFNFGGTYLKNLFSEVLWIDGTFNGHYSGYMVGSDGDNISPVINEFIAGHLVRLGISKERCTILGFSQGGSAALYYLASYGYKNAVVATPRFHVDESIKENRSGSIQKVSVSDNSKVDDYSESSVTAAIAADGDKEKNIYFYTSTNDEQQGTAQLDNWRILESYENFNRVLTETPLVQQFDDLVSYNALSIVAVLTLLSDGIVPRFGMAVNGSNDCPIEPLKPANSESEVSAAIEKFSIVGNKLFIEGVLVFHGLSSPNYNSQKSYAVFDRADNSFSIPLGHDKKTLISEEYYDSSFVDYSHSKFATIRYQGINLDNFPYGKHRVSIQSTHISGATTRVSNLNLPQSPELHFLDEYVIRTLEDKGTLFVLKRTYDELDNLPFEFRLDQIEVFGKKLYIKGLLAPYSFDFSEWGSIQFKIRFKEKRSGRKYVYSLANGNRLYKSNKRGEEHFDKSKAYFATKSYDGLDLSELINGTYEIGIAASFGSHAIHRRLSQNLEIQFSSPDRKATVAVIGSCVSRDLFNSKLNPGWRDFMSLGPEFYQMSIISLMSRPVELEQEKFDDLSSHDQLATMNDFNKRFLGDLRVSQPQYLLLDLFADSRFEVIKVGESFITDNSWKIGKSRAYKEYSTLQRSSPQVNSTEYYKLFEDSCIKLKSFLEENCPEINVILNSCRASLTWQSLITNGAFNINAIRSQNKRWTKLESIFIKIFNPGIIDTTKIILAGDPAHPWGKGPVHYEGMFYQTAARALFGKIYCLDDESHVREISEM